jgi:POT family proton-dependent oligopeptide transporter
MPETGLDDTIANFAEAKCDEYEDEKKLSSNLYVASSVYKDDGIHDGLEFPTEEDKNTLRRVSDSIPWSAYREGFLDACSI